MNSNKSNIGLIIIIKLIVVIVGRLIVGMIVAIATG